MEAKVKKIYMDSKDLEKKVQASKEPSPEIALTER
jgi:hypothetical protein